MNDLIRRALLGDREAQEECTRRGIVLPCSFCGGEARAFLRQPYTGNRHWYRCRKCLSKSHGYSTAEAALAAWNTRQAPLIVRCGGCSLWNDWDCKKETPIKCSCAHWSEDEHTVYTSFDDFCSYGEQKEADHETD